MQPTDNLKNLIQDTLYHLKSIEHRMAWSKAIHELRPQDKHKINQVITRVKNGILDIAMLVPNVELQRNVMAMVNTDDRIIYYMTLVEQLFTLDEPMLMEITDLIDNHLKQYADLKVAQVSGDG